MNNIEDLTCVSEKAIKKLISSYFSKYINSDYKSYHEIGVMFKDTELLSSFLLDGSLYKIPKSNGFLLEEDYLIDLVLSKTNVEWNESLFHKMSKDEITIIKNCISKLMSLSQIIFAKLKQKYSELENLNLKPNVNNVTLEISDILYPDYIHPLCINFNVINIKLKNNT